MERIGITQVALPLDKYSYEEVAIGYTKYRTPTRLVDKMYGSESLLSAL